MDKERLVHEAATALEAYRRLLPPGLYYFAGEVVGGECVGIIEEREDFSTKEQERESGVVFGFWPKGFVPSHLLSGSPLEWLYKYPFLPGVSGLASAPDRFVELLTEHVKERVYSNG